MLIQLIDVGYKLVREIEVPAKDWPGVILFGNRAFTPYYGAKPVDATPGPMAYREETTYVVPGVLVT